MNLGEAVRVPQHWPGPPKVTALNGSSQKPEDNGEIQQLRNELNLCMAKIKGYEILGHLFQESKQECARYKMQNEELVKKIDGLTASHLYGTPVLTEHGKDVVPPSTSSDSMKAGSHGHDTAFELVSAAGNSSNTSHLQYSDESVGTCGRGQPSDFAVRGQLPVEHERGFNLTEVGAKTPPSVVLKGMKSGGSSGSSSPSFIQISDTDVMSPALCSLTNKPSRHSDVTSTEYIAQMSTDLSVEINQITEQVRKLGQSGSSSSAQDLSADLIRAGVSVLKLQKQNRVQQIVMDKMKAEIADLTTSNADKQRLIQQLQEDCKSLGDRVKQMESSRGKALQEAHMRILETAEDPEDNCSTEWVEVEKHRSSGAAGDATGVVTATSMIEMELRRRVEKLSATITELVAVNRNWDEHCRELEANHKQQMTAMQNKLTELQNRIDEHDRTDEQRQLEFDNLLLHCKQQREAEEMAKEDALDQLHRERQQRTEAEFKCIEFSRKTAELEAELIELKSSQQVRSAQYTEPPQRYEHTMSAREQELCSQLVILREQINIFKEDFDQERSDREVARSKMEKMRRQLAEAQSRINSLHSQLTNTNSELRTAKAEKEQWRQRFQKLAGDLETVRRQAQPTLQATPPQRVPQHPAAAQPQVYTRFQPQPAGIKRPSWPCSMCTLRNSGTSNSCAACGTRKSQSFYQTDVSVGDRPIAGLLDYSPNQLYSALVSRSLETDVIDDTKQ